MRKTRDSRGITLVALVVTVIILIILAGITLPLVLGQNGIIGKAKGAKEASANDEKETAEELSNLENAIDSANCGQAAQLPDGSWNGTINTPKIAGTGLTAVYWNGTTWTKLTQSSSQDEWAKWYDYSKQQWANAQSADGSLWVWIPRYEYKINSSTHEIDINFKKIGDTTTDGYILHPAFTTDIDAGGWDSELPGFWVAKYAAGYQNSTAGETNKTVQYSDLKYTDTNGYTTNYLGTLTANTTSISYPVFKANTDAYNCISIADEYLLSQKISSASMYGLSNVDSHLEKNSEWGAVAYLTQSSYGRNGTEVTINSKNLNNANSDNVYAVTSYGNSGTPNDVTASSTNNMTGVFDLNGCVWEYTAAYFKGGTASTPVWYNAMANSNTTASTKYVTLYTENNKLGDATNETSGWNSDYAYFLTSAAPIFVRGGYYTNGSNSGIFAFYNFDGSANYSEGFRACLNS